MIRCRIIPVDQPGHMGSKPPECLWSAVELPKIPERGDEITYPINENPGIATVAVLGIRYVVGSDGTSCNVDIYVNGGRQFV